MSRFDPRQEGRGRSPVRAALLSGLATLLLLSVAALAWAWAVYTADGPEARQGDETIVVLPSGAGVSRIAGILDAAGVIRSETLFKVAVQLTGRERGLRAGEYAIASGASMSEVIEHLRSGEVVRHFVTIPEGWSSAQAMDILSRNNLLTGTAEAPPEGSILPETYEIQRGESRAALIARMQAAHDELLAELWPGRQQGLPFSTPEEAVILASIVEKETGIAEERPRVAAVFVNRLRLGMRLESDPTVVYGVSQGRPLGRGLRRSELDRPTPYNTYLVGGLPPTPIANPGREALEAVLNPPSTNELFFVADGTGGHVFARTFEEHLANVARWRQIERQRLEAQP
ncbi:endolytic transglycosylase MltG [Brevundimonas sp.]|uniref:endolytic transglycosylase MltG n=1 Tax=Brevundimonas sp. TaxID=1871086 RepID=UPI0025E915BE|nr:endolytic transglycosylase MltG [Brevundimonas sp.]